MERVPEEISGGIFILTPEGQKFWQDSAGSFHKVAIMG